MRPLIGLTSLLKKARDQRGSSLLAAAPIFARLSQNSRGTVAASSRSMSDAAASSGGPSPSKAQVNGKTFYDLEAERIVKNADGRVVLEPFPFSKLKGEVVLITNVATF